MSGEWRDAEDYARWMGEGPEDTPEPAEVRLMANALDAIYWALGSRAPRAQVADDLDDDDDGDDDAPPDDDVFDRDDDLNPREKGDDDGVEYADPRDEIARRRELNDD